MVFTIRNLFMKPASAVLREREGAFIMATNMTNSEAMVTSAALYTTYGCGRLAETSDANPGLRAPWSNFQPKNVWVKVRPHFGEGVSGSSEEGCFLDRKS